MIGDIILRRSEILALSYLSRILCMCSARDWLNSALTALRCCAMAPLKSRWLLVARPNLVRGLLLSRSFLGKKGGGSV
jgi:hypothetical protein